MGFFQWGGASQPHASRALGFFWRHASPDIFVREHFEMDLQFILEVLIRVVGGKPRASSGSERSYPGKHWVIPAPRCAARGQLQWKSFPNSALRYGAVYAPLS